MRCAAACARWLGGLCLVVAAAELTLPTASAQTWRARGTADLGSRTFTASDSFEAIVGTATGVVFGGGAELVLPQGIFANLRVSRFEKTGQRVFVFDGETFELDIDTTIRVIPVEVTGGYRFRDIGRRVTPYIGGGLGWHLYRETSEFAEDNENANETFQGYHLLGGAELRLARWLGVGGEFQWTTVPDALGQRPNGVSAAFGESDLGGTAFRVRFVVNR